MLQVALLSVVFYFILRSGGKTLLTFVYDNGLKWLLELGAAFLLTHLTDVQGEGARFADGTMTTLLHLGNAPLARNGTVRVMIQLNAPLDCTVFELATNGKRLGTIPAEAADGLLRFTVTVSSPNGARFFYEIARNEKH